MTDDQERPAKKPRARPRTGRPGEVVIRVMLPAEVAARADRIGGVGQAALTRLVIRLLEEAEREASPEETRR